MGRLRLMAAECKYKEFGKHLKEQILDSLIDDGVMMEIIRELASVVSTSSVTRAQVLGWVRRMITQRAQTAMLDS